MFEKEAEEYKDTYFGFADERISEVQDFEGNYIDISERIMKTFIDGAEFGYNKSKEDADRMKSRFLELCNLKDMRIAELEKANEWHYVKDGDLPKDDKNFKSYVVAYYGAKGSIANGKPCWEELCYDTENKRWVDKETLDDIPYVNQEGIVIAWKEIVLPELKESE